MKSLSSVSASACAYVYADVSASLCAMEAVLKH